MNHIHYLRHHHHMVNVLFLKFAGSIIVLKFDITREGPKTIKIPNYLGGKKIWRIRLKSAKLSSRHMIMNFFCLPPYFFFILYRIFHNLTPKSIQYQCFNPDFGPKNPPTVKLNSRKNCFSFKDRDTNLIISLRENKTSPDNAESQNIV